MVLILHIAFGLGFIAYYLGQACWTWFSGGQWYPERQYRRYVTRPVRATGQAGLTLVVLGLVVEPAVTGWTLAALTTTLFGSAGAYRLRCYLDRLQAQRPVRVRARVGAPTRSPSPTAGPDASTRRPVAELEAAR
jgi:hypothetical protein